VTKSELLQFTPPVGKLLGREIVRIDEAQGGATVRYVAQPEFLNRHGTVQGGLLAAMLDSATSLALIAVLPTTLTSVTKSIQVTFVKPATIGVFTATSKLVSRDDRGAETAAELHDAEGTLVATAVAKLRILPRKTG
jgi:uncharacterized protein (TIGR00369 family)